MPKYRKGTETHQVTRETTYMPKYKKETKTHHLAKKTTPQPRITWLVCNLINKSWNVHTCPRFVHKYLWLDQCEELSWAHLVSDKQRGTDESGREIGMRTRKLQLTRTFAAKLWKCPQFVEKVDYFLAGRNRGLIINRWHSFWSCETYIDIHLKHVPTLTEEVLFAVETHILILANGSQSRCRGINILISIWSQRITFETPIPLDEQKYN